MPDLRQLRTFVAVAEELNFTRAAGRLHLAQQAVSKSVAQLEAELGVALLERTSHAVGLTAAGAALLDGAREVLAAADATFARAQAVGRGVSGTARIGVTPAVGFAVRDEIVAALRHDATELSVALHEVRPDAIATLLRDRTLDVVLSRTAPRAPGLESAALRPTPASLQVPVEHPAAAQAGISIRQLDGERLLTWNPPGTPYTDLLIDRLAAGGARVTPVEAAVTGGGGPLGEVDAGTVALLPAGWPTGARFVEVPLDEVITLPLFLLWPAGVRTAVAERLRANMAAAA